MKCDQFTTWITVGNAFQRRRAERHAEHCHRCAEARQQLQALVADLAVTPSPLTTRERALWMAACSESIDDARTSGIRPLRRVYWAAAAAVVACATLAASYWWTRGGMREGNAPVVQRSQPTPSPGTAVAALPDLSDLERELADLRVRVDLLGARQEADSLWKRYTRVGGSGDEADLTRQAAAYAWLIDTNANKAGAAPVLGN
jgi:hypothetical protein